MNIGSEINIKTNIGERKGRISNIIEQDEMTTYIGYIDGRHGFEIINIKKDNRYSGEVFWDQQYSKRLGHNASFIEEFSEA